MMKFFLKERYVIENRNDLTPPIQLSDEHFRTDRRLQENRNDITRHIQLSSENFRTDHRSQENGNDIMLSTQPNRIAITSPLGIKHQVHESCVPPASPKPFTTLSPQAAPFYPSHNMRNHNNQNSDASHLALLVTKNQLLPKRLS
jgi:hypothetical protein